MNEPDRPGGAAAAPTRPLGLFALGIAVVCFSLGSTLVKKAGIPGPTMAFWRMLLTAASWTAILWFTEHRTVTRAELRRALVPGVVFGLNIVCFFTGVTKTSVANAEFIGSLTPLIVVPAGAILFHEKINTKALWFGLLSIVGLTIVLFNAPPRGSASWTGNFLIVGAVCLWAAYLLTSRRLRETMSVQAIMAAIMPIAAVTVFPITLATGNLDELTVHSLPYIVILALLTGTLAHGMIVYAQRTVPVGTIGIMQVAQPALAVLWAYLLLDQTILPIQLLGMAMVLGGIIAVVTITRRGAAADARAAAAIDADLAAGTTPADG
ncbi:MAG: DMT family transporter [Actinomycetota bacterium]